VSLLEDFMMPALCAPSPGETNIGQSGMTASLVLLATTEESAGAAVTIKTVAKTHRAPKSVDFPNIDGEVLRQDQEERKNENSVSPC
jgi:hypothetical protein